MTLHSSSSRGRRPRWAAKRPILLSALLLALCARAFCLDPVQVPLFPPLPAIALPTPSDSDAEKVTVELGQMRKALAYYQAYEGLVVLINQTIYPVANQIATERNELLAETLRLKKINKFLFGGFLVTSGALLLVGLAR